MAESQAKRLIRIETALTDKEKDKEGDPLLLISVQGVEGISTPFSYDVTMLREADKGDIDTKQLIGTVAQIGVRTGPEDDNIYTHRFGVFEHLEKSGKNDKDFLVYRGLIVPAFKMTARETAFRIFENKDVVEIITEVLDGFPNLTFNTNLLKQEQFPKLEYCVQFGETTFGFVTRMLASYGIWYFFDHTLDKQHETMVLGRDQNRVANADHAMMDIVDGDSGPGAVAGFTRRFEPPAERASVGDFNILKPTDPIHGEEKVLQDYDLLGANGQDSRFATQTFPGPFLADNRGADDNAKRRMKAAEVATFSAIGSSKNPTFYAGRTFVVNDDKTSSDQKGKKHLLTTLTFAGLETSYGRNFLTNIGDFLKNAVKSLGFSDPQDVATGLASGLLNTVLKDEKAFDQARSLLPNNDAAKTVTGIFSGDFSSLAALIPTLIQAIKDMFKVTSSYANSFVAVPFEGPKFLLLPPAASPKPVAYGPHLATVIGPNGISAPPDFHADALGRVRVRFPWDPGPKDSSGDPFQSGANTCWVRVVEGWAGSRFGTQFLPRIGQEVLVAFIDGDPDRPVITGRMYNADRGPTNLPFPAPGTESKNLTTDDLLNPSPSTEFQRSGIKTRSTPKPDGGKDGFHLVRFDDSFGKEQLLIRSQARMDVTALHSRYETTKGDRHVLVQGGHDDQGNALGGGSYTTTSGEYDLHVGDNRYENVDKNFDLTVKGDMIADLQGNYTTIVGQTATLNAFSIILEARMKISLVVGNSFVVLTPAGVFINGPMVQINSGGSPDSSSSPDVTDAADAAMADPGDPPNWLAQQPKGGGGGHHHHTARAWYGLPFVLKDGKLSAPGGDSLKIDAKDPAFADAAARDITKLASAPDGAEEHAILNQAGTAKNPVVITKSDKPENAGTSPDSLQDATAKDKPTGKKDAKGNPELGTGKGTGSTVAYNPSDWPKKGDPDSPTSDEVLKNSLEDANEMGKGQSDPTTWNQTPPPKP